MRESLRASYSRVTNATFVAIVSFLLFPDASLGQMEVRPSSSSCSPSFGTLDTVGILAGGNRALGVADFNKDGKLDIAGGIESDSGKFFLSWWENRFPMSLDRHNVGAIFASTLAVGDINGDGHEDLVCPRDNQPGLYWYENLGNGTFAGHVVDSIVSAGGYAIGAVDLDDDVDLDVIATIYIPHPDSGMYHWCVFENDGDGSFTRHPQISPGFISPRPLYITSADLDNDGDADIVMPGDSLGLVRWWENLGGLNFRADSLHGQVNGVNLVVCADLDSDNDQDIIAASSSLGGGGLWWWENLGLGNFSLNAIATGTGAVRWLSSADIDNDGDVDVLCDNPFRWWENDGAENYSSYVLAGSFSNQGGTILPADLDGDCRTDIVASDWRGNTIVWWQNDCIPQLCACHADPQCDSVISDIQDVVLTINVAFRGQAPVGDVDCGWERTDVDCSGSTDVLDVVHVISVAFRNTAIGDEYCNPCP